MCYMNKTNCCLMETVSNIACNVGHCRSKEIGGNADDKNYKCSRIIHLLNRITSALIVAMLLLGAGYHDYGNKNKIQH